MNPKTDVTIPGADKGTKSEFSPMFLRWIIALTIVTLLLAFFGDFIFARRPLGFSPIPWTMAGGIILEQGLTLFRGQDLTPISMEQKVNILAGLLMIFVIAPTLLLFSWRRLVTEPKQSKMSPSSIGFVFGVIFASASVFGTVLPAIVHPRIAASMREAQDLAENRDLVIHGLWRVSADAYQYRILPKRYGGGAGSYRGYTVPPSLRQMDANEFVLTTVTDTSFTILGSSTKFPGAGIKATYGRQGKLAGTFTFLGSFE